MYNVYDAVAGWNLTLIGRKPKSLQFFYYYKKTHMYLYAYILERVKPSYVCNEYVDTAADIETVRKKRKTSPGSSALSVFCRVNIYSLSCVIYIWGNFLPACGRKFWDSFASSQVSSATVLAEQGFTSINQTFPTKIGRLLSLLKNIGVSFWLTWRFGLVVVLVQVQ